jgi:hypothetical protein
MDDCNAIMRIAKNHALDLLDAIAAERGADTAQIYAYGLALGICRREQQHRRHRDAFDLFNHLADDCVEFQYEQESILEQWRCMLKR